jgi:hypothetical protein
VEAKIEAILTSILHGTVVAGFEAIVATVQ